MKALVVVDGYAEIGAGSDGVILTTARESLKGCCAACAVPVGAFKAMQVAAGVAYKTLSGNWLAKMFPRPLVKVEDFPSFGQVTVSAQGQKRRIVHLLTYLPELRGRSQIIEEPIEIGKITLALRTDGLIFKKVYLVPSGTRLVFSVKDGYARVLVPKVRGYQMVVFE